MQTSGEKFLLSQAEIRTGTALSGTSTKRLWKQQKQQPKLDEPKPHSCTFWHRTDAHTSKHSLLHVLPKEAAGTAGAGFMLRRPTAVCKSQVQLENEGIFSLVWSRSKLLKYP